MTLFVENNVVFSYEPRINAEFESFSRAISILSEKIQFNISSVC